MKRDEFECFKSEVCHRVKGMGNLAFIKEMLMSDEIERYWESGRYAESLYLLSMVDYLSRLEDIPLCDKYSSIRTKRLDPPIYPVSEEIYCRIMDLPLDRKKDYIPEFAAHGIMEADIFDVY